MKLKEIGLISHFPIWEFVNSPSPLVFIKIGDRQIDLVNCKRINGKFFHTKDGVFELDGEYENVMNGQSFYIYNLQNSKPISLRHIEKIQKLYRSNETAELTDMLSSIAENLDKGMTPTIDDDGEAITSYTSPLDALKKIINEKPNFISEDVIKFIVNYKWFDMADLKIFNFKKIFEPKPDRDISKKIPTIIPMVVVSVIGIGSILALAFGGIGHLVRAIGDPRIVPPPAELILGINGLLGIFS